MRYRRVYRCGDDDDAYTAAMADMLAGLIFIFIVVAMTFALFSREVQQQLRTSPLKKVHADQLARLAAQLSERGFRAEPLASESLVRVRCPGLFNIDAYGLSAQSDCVVNGLNDALVHWLADYAAHNALPSDEQVTYSRFVFQLHSANAKAVDALLLTTYRALTLHASLLERNRLYAVTQNASGQSFFLFVGLGDSRIPTCFCEELVGECDTIDLVLIPSVPIKE